MTTRKKIALLGDSAVGKTSLIRRYVFNQFEDSYIATIGTKVTRKELKIKRPHHTVDLTFVIWDLIGREGYQGLHARTFAGVSGALLVADLTRKETLVSLERYWIPLLFKVVDSVPLVFVVNKSDLENEYDFEPEDIVDIALRYNGRVDGILPKGLSTCYSTSAKTGENVEHSFESLGHLLVSSFDLQDPVKELYENLVALGIHRSMDKTTPIGALDTIIVDFCQGFEDSRTAMLILRQEVTRAGLDINNPTKEGILKAIEYLAEAESEYMDEKTVLDNREKRMDWARKVSE
ncbi:MAG: GTP-binding protein [Methanomassiliicoccales archaeon]|nr:MAG: GTP-binding protein [Methanomassiliicoccales archaeon]